PTAEVVIQVGRGTGTQKEMLEQARDQTPPVGAPFKALRDDAIAENAPVAKEPDQSRVVAATGASSDVPRLDDDSIRIADTADASAKPTTTEVAVPSAGKLPQLSGTEMAEIMSVLTRGIAGPAEAASNQSRAAGTVQAPVLPLESRPTPGDPLLPGADTSARVSLGADVSSLRAPVAATPEQQAVAAINPTTPAVPRDLEVSAVVPSAEGLAERSTAPAQDALTDSPASTSRPLRPVDPLPQIGDGRPGGSDIDIAIDQPKTEDPAGLPPSQPERMAAVMIIDRPSSALLPGLSFDPSETLLPANPPAAMPSMGAREFQQNPGRFDEEALAQPAEGSSVVIARVDPQSMEPSIGAGGRALNGSPIDRSQREIDPVSEASHIAPLLPLQMVPRAALPAMDRSEGPRVARYSGSNGPARPAETGTTRYGSVPSRPLSAPAPFAGGGSDLPLGRGDLVQVYLNPRSGAAVRITALDPLEAATSTRRSGRALSVSPVDPSQDQLALAPPAEDEPSPREPVFVKPTPRPDSDPQQSVQPEDPVPAQIKDPTCTAPASTTLEVRRAARSMLEIDAPCHAGTIAELVYSGMRLAVDIDDFGKGRIEVLGFEPNSYAQVHLAGGDVLEFDIPFKGMDRISRVAVVWDQPIDIDLNAIEFGETPGGENHVWTGNPRSFRDVRRNGGGFLTAFSKSGPFGQNAQVYSHYSRRGGETGVVKLAIDFVTRNRDRLSEACGQGAYAEPEFMVIRSEDGRLSRPILRRLASLKCSRITEETGDKRLISGAVQDLIVTQR
ncbi:MAG: hypothetical protein AAF334_05870, partial [Pseudomonadota bacterium]